MSHPSEEKNSDNDNHSQAFFLTFRIFFKYPDPDYAASRAT